MGTNRMLRDRGVRTLGETHMRTVNLTVASLIIPIHTTLPLTTLSVYLPDPMLVPRLLPYLLDRPGESVDQTRP